MELWLIEIAKGFGRLFLNPLLYWTIILLSVTSLLRIRKERRQFGRKIYPFFSELKQSGLVSMIFGLIISLVTIFLGIIFTREMIIILLIVTILLSITGSLKLLSPTYTIGLTFLVMIGLSFLPIDNYYSLENLSIVNYISLAFILGVLLLAEVFLINTYPTEKVYPSMSVAQRGGWIGQYEMKRMAMIPFFILLPANEMVVQLPLFPYFLVGDNAYQLVFIPFILGFNYQSRVLLPSRLKSITEKYTYILSILVLLFVLGSLFYPVLVLAALIFAIIGREWIVLKLKRHERQSAAIFTALDQGVKVLNVASNSRAEHLGIKIGEVILKVNGEVVSDSVEFYNKLQEKGSFFEIEIIDINGENRIVKSPIYAADHHELGIIFPEEPYKTGRKKQITSTVEKDS